MFIEQHVVTQCCLNCLWLLVETLKYCYPHMLISMPRIYRLLFLSFFVLCVRNIKTVKAKSTPLPRLHGGTLASCLHQHVGMRQSQ